MGCRRRATNGNGGRDRALPLVMAHWLGRGSAALEGLHYLGADARGQAAPGDAERACCEAAALQRHAFLNVFD
jgi:hypothetical protein